MGRAPNCDIKIPSANISKEHTRIEVFDDKLIISDAGSRNGTFLNGIQIRSSKAKTGDKIAIHDIFFEVQKATPSFFTTARSSRSAWRPRMKRRSAMRANPCWTNLPRFARTAWAR
jgi:pSer/pThr/pTyr-binding forkhead associated (FHA) protein